MSRYEIRIHFVRLRQIKVMNNHFYLRNSQFQHIISDFTIMIFWHMPPYPYNEWFLYISSKIFYWKTPKITFALFLQSGGPYCSDLVMLTHNLLVTGRLNTLVVWDVRLPDPVKLVKIGHPEESSQGVRIMCHLDDAIVCSYGSTLRLVKFPNFSAKSD